MSEEVVELQLSPEQMRHSQGACWVIALPGTVALGDDLDNPAQSGLLLFEEDQPLGPAHALHNRIRVVGCGMYSHWGNQLYFSSSDNEPPDRSGRRFTIRAPRATGEDQAASTQGSSFSLIEKLAPELRKLAPSMSMDMLTESAGPAEERMQMLERKVEYLLDELYAAKSQLRHLTPASAALRKLRDYQIGTFDFQWDKLPYHDAFMSNPEWRPQAADDLCRRIERPAGWLRGRKVLDCGCGPGRHTWTFASMGADVTAFDTSPTGLAAARRETGGMPNVVIEQHNILEPLPYGPDFDLVWCYGVVHCTGDTFGALSNIASRVKPGGMLYFMVYPEPERNNAEAYRYYHEIYVLRQMTRHMPFQQKAELLKHIQGERWALSWFDAISSEINDLYTMEELTQLLGWLGFSDVRRTMAHENSLNVTAIRNGGQAA